MVVTESAVHICSSQDVDAPYCMLHTSSKIVSGMQDTSDACCQACRSEAKCNVWVWCGDAAGCATGRSHKECWLKSQPSLNVDRPAGGRGDGEPFAARPHLLYVPRQAHI